MGKHKVEKSIHRELLPNALLLGNVKHDGITICNVVSKRFPKEKQNDNFTRFELHPPPKQVQHFLSCSGPKVQIEKTGVKTRGG